MDVGCSQPSVDIVVVVVSILDDICTIFRQKNSENSGKILIKNTPQFGMQNQLPTWPESEYDEKQDPSEEEEDPPDAEEEDPADDEEGDRDAGRLARAPR